MSLIANRSRFMLLSLLTLLIALVASAATGLAPANSLLGPKAAHADAGEQILVPDGNMWCKNWGDSQLGNAVDIEYNFIRMEGSARENNATCFFMVSSGVGEKVAGRWYGWNGYVPLRVQMDWNNACQLQYPGSYVRWYDITEHAFLTTDPGDDIATNTGQTWLCVAPSGRSYDQSSSAGGYLNG